MIKIKEMDEHMLILDFLYHFQHDSDQKHQAKCEKSEHNQQHSKCMRWESVYDTVTPDN